jgi:hypothetical protein
MSASAAGWIASQMLVFVLARRAPTIRPPPRRRAWFTMLDDAESAEPLRGDSAKCIRSASPVKPISFRQRFRPSCAGQTRVLVHRCAPRLSASSYGSPPRRCALAKAVPSRSCEESKYPSSGGHTGGRCPGGIAYFHPHSAGDGVCGDRHHARPRQRRALDELNSS